MGILKTINSGLKSINKCLDSVGKGAESLSIKAAQLKDDVALEAAKETLKMVDKTKAHYEGDPEGFKKFLELAEAYGMNENALKLLKANS